jgi:lipopolysaccharide transport system ATP-binding protein
MTAVKSLCSRAMWLDAGRIVNAGETEGVITDYLQNGARITLAQEWNDHDSAPGGDKVRLHRVSITALGQGTDEPITVKTALELNAAFWNYLPGAFLSFSVVLYNRAGVAIFNTGAGGRSFPAGLVSGSFVIPGDFLNDDIYAVRLLLIEDSSVVLLDLHDLVVFEVHDTERETRWYGKWIGAVRPMFKWEIRVDEPPAEI